MNKWIQVSLRSTWIHLFRGYSGILKIVQKNIAAANLKMNKRIKDEEEKK